MGHIHWQIAFRSAYSWPSLAPGQHAATDILRTDILRMVRAPLGIGTIRPSGLTMAFVPPPSDRAELNTYPLELDGPAMPAAE